MTRAWLVLSVGWVVLAGAPHARADNLINAVNLTDVASSFDDNNKFDFRFRVRYDHTEKRATIKRELEQPGQTTIELFKDLVYEAHRDVVSLRTEIGLYHDLMLSLELPIIIGQQAVYGYDQFPGCHPSTDPDPKARCVDASNSTSIADGIVPVGGYDATARGVGTGGSTVFRGVMRGARGGSGGDAFDTFNVGLTWAPLSQARDDTKPTWVVLVEGQFSIGNVMRFDRSNPDANHGVSEGTHRLFVRTALSKRYRYFEPYWGLWYLLPIAKGGTDSLFVDYGPTQKTKNPQMQGGTVFGTAVIPYSRPAKQYQVSFDLRARIEGHFNGRGYSEGWELFASAPPLACDASGAPVMNSQWNPACNPGGPKNGYNDHPAFTGVTTIENYASIGTDIAFQAQVGPYFRLRTGFEYQRDQGHYITGEDIGKPMNATGRVMDPNEFNPAYRPVVDLPGRRYRVEDVNVYDFYISAQAMF